MQQQRLLFWKIRTLPCLHINLLPLMLQGSSKRCEGDSARQIRQQLRDKAWTPISVDPVEQKDKHQSQGLFQKVQCL